VRWGAANIKGSASEVTAIPALLGLLELRGCIVTLDAMGCQREIAEQIREQGADYVLAVKANQAENFAVIRHIALNLLKREPSNGSLRQKRYKAALSTEFRSNVLFPQEDYALALGSASARKAANHGSRYPAKFESE
jgi:predicted transposase YbfD/YdcC